MIRRRQLLPDQQIHTEAYGPVPCISDSAFDAAMLDLAAMIRFAGGCASVVTARHPTDFPSEMVTIHAVFEWKDRTDAKAQAEAAAPTPPVVEQTVGQQFDAAMERLQAEVEPHADGEALQRYHETLGELGLERQPDVPGVNVPPEDDPEYEPATPSPDGLDYTALPEEDLDAIPVEQR